MTLVWLALAACWIAVFAMAWLIHFSVQRASAPKRTVTSQEALKRLDSHFQAILNPDYLVPVTEPEEFGRKAS